MINERTLIILGEIEFLSNLGKNYEKFNADFLYKKVSSKSKAFNKLKDSSFDAELSLKNYELREYVMSLRNFTEEDYFNIVMSLKLDFNGYFKENIIHNVIDKISEKHINDIIYIENIIFSVVLPLFFLGEEGIEKFPFFSQMLEIIKHGHLPCDWKQNMFHIY